MGKIKPLPEAVRNSVRSGIIVCDLTRVVEELVFNSLDAGATKVSVSVGVGTCSVKVMDNGSGVDRDGLVLLGERHATSKHHQLADLDTANQNFGFRGEALCSISDVSLLEIITKAHGRPHGYRKVMKDCKCLYLGISDDRHDAGTTVVVRDLFYNQPVRRKLMQSSPKKVLHLVKKCVLRIALVHPRVSFRVSDIESEEELLSTSSSPSPLPLLSTNFGIEAACSLYEIKAVEREFKLFGYLSSPFGILSPKAFQYIYINSRFICKGPIHKLLNHLASGYWDDQRFNIGAKNEKQSRSQTCPTFILNLSCPRSYYDMTFEPLKNSVEFTEWGPVLVFIQNTITHYWSESISNDLLLKDQTGRKRCRTKDWLASPEVHCSQSQKLMRECKNLPAWEEGLSSRQKSDGDASELQKHKTDALFEDCDIQSFNASPFHCGVTTNKKIRNHMQSSADYFSDGDDILVKEESTKGTGKKKLNYFFDSQWQDESFEMDDEMNMSIRSPFYTHSEEYGEDAFVNQLFRRPSQLSCLTGRGLQDVGSSHLTKVETGFGSYDFRTQHKWINFDEGSDGGKEYDTDQIFIESLSRNERVKSLWSLSRCTNQPDKITNANSSSQDLRSSMIAGECSGEENNLPSGSLKHIKQSDGDKLSSTSEWSPRVLPSLFGTEIPDVDHLIGQDVCCDYSKGTTSGYIPDQEGDYGHFNRDPSVNSWELENCTDLSSFKFYSDHLGDVSEARGRKHNDFTFANCSSVFPDEMDWLLMQSCGKNSLPKVSNPLDQTSLPAQFDRNKFGRIHTSNGKKYRSKERARRSHSAPPFYRPRRKFIGLNYSWKMEGGRTDSPAVNNDSALPETSNSLHQQQSLGQCHSPLKASYANNCSSVCRLNGKDFQKKGQCINCCNFKLVEDSTSKETRDDLDSGLKWRKSSPQAVDVMKSQVARDHDCILDVSSGFLHLAGDSLIPSFIDKNCLKDAKVLPQVDKKFIPVVAGRILAIIDQHAADERIRLEELRQKVLDGEMKQVAYLEAEQELVLPEIGYQLLHNYVSLIENWGWICNISGRGASSFGKNLNVLCRQPTVAKLVAVPCILGVKLTDIDLLEFLQQLADTDGSSTIPPSVHRVLNSKACRGAIMFGDTLLPSECSLIVEELKQASLCFQCAHGRPTTVPLVNLDILHKQIDKLGLRSSGTCELWQGLCRQEISLERAASRLTSAME
nr:LOW QUALITY PROTEIN: DNA mismatch repair protein MLH3-like [Coffea arabica]